MIQQNQSELKVLLSGEERSKHDRICLRAETGIRDAGKRISPSFRKLTPTKGERTRKANRVQRRERRRTTRFTRRGRWQKFPVAWSREKPYLFGISEMRWCFARFVVFSTHTHVHRFIQRKLNVRRNHEFLFLPLTTICSPGDLNLGNGH